MERISNKEVTEDKITWDRHRIKWHNNIVYRSEILKHDDHISISKTMYVNGEYKRMDLVHVPFSLIDDIKHLVINEQNDKIQGKG